MSPEGTTDCVRFRRPFGTWVSSNLIPALKRWAILKNAFGMIAEKLVALDLEIRARVESADFVNGPGATVSGLLILIEDAFSIKNPFKLSSDPPSEWATAGGVCR